MIITGPDISVLGSSTAHPSEIPGSPRISQGMVWPQEVWLYFSYERWDNLASNQAVGIDWPYRLEQTIQNIIIIIPGWEEEMNSW